MSAGMYISFMLFYEVRWLEKKLVCLPLCGKEQPEEPTREGEPVRGSRLFCCFFLVGVPAIKDSY